ncbi:hypothetical protein EDB84DRAFT_1553291, partial [Lactarius hengduanensis]
ITHSVLSVLWMFSTHAAPSRGLSNSSLTCCQPRRPPLQSFISRGSVRDRLRLPATTQTSRAPCSPMFLFLTSPHLRAALETQA